MLGLRTAEGLDLKDIQQRFPNFYATLVQQSNKWVSGGALILENERCFVLPTPGLWSTVLLKICLFQNSLCGDFVFCLFCRVCVWETSNTSNPKCFFSGCIRKLPYFYSMYDPFQCTQRAISNARFGQVKQLFWKAS